MPELKMEVSIADIDKVQTLIELLNKHQDSLPRELIDSLHELADCEVCEINRSWLDGRGISGRIENSLGLKRILSVNPVLKRVKVIGGPDIYPKEFALLAGGKVIVSWQ